MQRYKDVGIHPQYCPSHVKSDVRTASHVNARKAHGLLAVKVVGQRLRLSSEAKARQR